MKDFLMIVLQACMVALNIPEVLKGNTISIVGLIITSVCLGTVIGLCIADFKRIK